ncbi:MAG: thioredoxin family protein [Schleiferiaceae bacterium]|nr:thioredoxin family protein [Schleiferiaceae bacterium]MDR9443286.1 thioredoxin family protein [Schleiferiaceae bacterium]
MTLEEWHIMRAEEPAVLLYFYQERCGVCKALFPKVQARQEKAFPGMRLVPVNARKSSVLAGQLRMLSVPGLLVFIDGREVSRANGHIALARWEEEIQRLYEQFYDLGDGT